MKGLFVNHSPSRRHSASQLKSFAIKWSIRLLLICVVCVISFFSKIKFKRKTSDKIILTGTFLSDNWIRSLLLPLSRSNYSGKIIFVASQKMPPIKNIEAYYPPGWLQSNFDEKISRLLTFAYLCLKYRPQYVLGISLLLNGITAIAISKIIGAKSIYNCTSGENEIVGGGKFSGSRFFSSLDKPDLFSENLLIKIVNHSDLIIARGKKQIDFFRSKGISTKHSVITASVDSRQFFPSSPDLKKCYDLITVGRLVNLKRLDIFLALVLKLKNDGFKDISAAIVGTGTLESDLKRMADDFNIQDNVRFLGFRNDVGSLLRKSKIFILSSDREGMSQSMLQAMFCGLPVVVSDVGAHSELVVSRKNGFLVSNLDVNSFFKPVKTLLSDPEIFNRIGKAATSDVQDYAIENLSIKWSYLLNQPYRSFE